jgi:hypothetical protein
MWRSKTFTISKIAYCFGTDKCVIIIDEKCNFYKNLNVQMNIVLKNRCRTNMNDQKERKVT